MKGRGFGACRLGCVLQTRGPCTRALPNDPRCTARSALRRRRRPPPDREGEREACQAVRDVFDDIDWPCHVVRDFAPENMGAGPRIISALQTIADMTDKFPLPGGRSAPQPGLLRADLRLARPLRGPPPRELGVGRVVPALRRADPVVPLLLPGTPDARLGHLQQRDQEGELDARPQGGRGAPRQGPRPLRGGDELADCIGMVYDRKVSTWTTSSAPIRSSTGSCT